LATVQMGVSPSAGVVPKISGGPLFFSGQRSGVNSDTSGCDAPSSAAPLFSGARLQCCRQRRLMTLGAIIFKFGRFMLP
jgi:hypothetical protein